MTDRAKSYQERIREKLTAAFSPARLEVIDESDHHRGHGGWREGGETHFRVRIVAESFRGASRVEMHRLINRVLAEELAERVHALAIEASAP
ncbi:BolA family protein [Prosthecomicrobium sp. N25]|uniref:BolA family protein n=1 Tax=Prosthecomicrobium sp. N25 TaxID=3129254 RepID=UPI003077089B